MTFSLLPPAAPGELICIFFNPTARKVGGWQSERARQKRVMRRTRRTGRTQQFQIVVVLVVVVESLGRGLNFDVVVLFPTMTSRKPIMRKSQLICCEHSKVQRLFACQPDPTDMLFSSPSKPTHTLSVPVIKTTSTPHSLHIKNSPKTMKFPDRSKVRKIETCFWHSTPISHFLRHRFEFRDVLAIKLGIPRPVKLFYCNSLIILCSLHDRCLTSICHETLSSGY